MAINPMQLGKLFKKMNAGEQTLKDLTPRVRRQVLDTKGTANRGTEAHRYWQGAGERTAGPGGNSRDPVLGAVDEIESGLRSSFKNVDDTVIQEQAKRIYDNLDGNTLSEIGSGKSKFGQMLRTEMGERSPDIQTYVTSATGSRGWLGQGATQQTNFHNVADRTNKRIDEKISSFKQNANERNTQLYRADDFAKMEYDNKQALTQHLREEGFNKKATNRTMERIEKEAIEEGSGFIGRNQSDKDAAVDMVYRRRGEARSGEHASEARVERNARRARKDEERRRERGETEGSGRNVENEGMRKFMSRNFDKDLEELRGGINSGQDLNQKTISRMADKSGLEGREREKFMNMIENKQGKDALNIIEKNRENYINNPSMGDQMRYNKVPQKAAVAVGGAWLVNSMFSSGGQQSNAQLYGQQQQMY